MSSTPRSNDSKHTQAKSSGHHAPSDAKGMDPRKAWLGEWRLKLFAWCTGIIVLLGIQKFGTPVILQDQVEAPQGWIQWLFFPWQIQTAYMLFVIWGVAAARTLPFRNTDPMSKWLWLPLLWLGWQFLSAFFTVDKALTQSVLAHFMCLVGLFYAGYFLLSKRRELQGMVGWMLAALVLTMWSGTEQKMGGLEATRQMIYQQPYWQQTYSEAFLKQAMEDQAWLQSIRRDETLLNEAATRYGFTTALNFQGEGQSPLERDLAFLEKIGKDRIFGTLFYPNALAAVILLLLPISTVGIWKWTHRLQVPSRALLAACFLLWALACIYWSGSKGGWLVGMVSVCLMLLLANLNKNLKWALAIAMLVIGGGGFAWKYQDYFQKGATSVGARMEYWKAGWATSLEHPILGTGPGTFMRAFSKIRPDGAEMTRLTHNDYLQQASDAGWPSALLYTVWMMGSLILLRPRKLGQDPIREAIWLGVTALAMQNIIEFGLYIPAIAWPHFLLLGWLWGTRSKT